ncbi:hypothetical protein [Rhizobium sp. SL86]|uniref:hypothetical protein n=1 Tax=Rhizobium sp. SL86 TaxID=2995148 RepID=UPI002274155B|nr:hypothetical protein [Rhizobium sp. SL86]MCY1666815.1 hypothetical protein [Rhizobium sp. SL86]
MRQASRIMPLVLSLIVALAPWPALAHGAEGGIVLLLPTGYYILGAAFTVLVTFLLISLLPDGWTRAIYRGQWSLAKIPAPSAATISSLSFLMLLSMVLAGLLGARDPLTNPLPAFIWTIFWVCLTILHGLLGPLWQALNPWTGPLAVFRRATGSSLGDRPIARLPWTLGYAIAILQFFGFAWFELVDLAPSDPTRLAVAVSLYWLVNFTAMMLFGERAWCERAEPFSIFFSLIGRCAPFDWRKAEDGRLQIALGWPGRFLFGLPPLSASGVLFVLLTLGTVSFDGLSRTFVWLAAIGVNPLDFPGRSAIVTPSTLGILGTWGALAALFFASVLLGGLLSGERRFGLLTGRLVYSIIPISLAFQIAHYLTLVLVEAQNFLKAVADPFALGWNLTGTRDLHVTTSFLNVYDSVVLIFNTQTIAIAVGHVIAVILAHALLLDLTEGKRRVFLAELPLAALMVFYTAFGLWLLSTPRI